MLHWIADRIDRMVAATLPTWAAWAQIASVLVSVMIAVAVYLASRRLTENTNKLLAETRGLIHANRRAELIREVSQANTTEHLRSLRDEITASFRSRPQIDARMRHRLRHRVRSRARVHLCPRLRLHHPAPQRAHAA